MQNGGLRCWHFCGRCNAPSAVKVVASEPDDCDALVARIQPEADRADLGQPLMKGSADAAAAAAVYQAQLARIAEQRIVQRTLDPPERLVYGQAVQIDFDGRSTRRVRSVAVGVDVQVTGTPARSARIGGRDLFTREHVHPPADVDEDAAVVPHLTDNPLSEGGLHRIAFAEMRSQGYSTAASPERAATARHGARNVGRTSHHDGIGTLRSQPVRAAPDTCAREGAVSTAKAGRAAIVAVRLDNGRAVCFVPRLLGGVSS